mmetsp:Transcript_4679/g.14653  ORF Transcript_4679/g.14653 Transcript_4679/m.14653 type:complete len:304 (+) Transcript_4679:391-1302(+)
MLFEEVADRLAVSNPRERHERRYSIDSLLVERFSRDVGHEALRVDGDRVAVLHPTGVRAGPALADAVLDRAARHVVDLDRVFGLDLHAQVFQRDVRVVVVRLAAARTRRGFDEATVDGVAIAPVVVGVQRVADRREQERAHRRRLSSSVAGRERPQRRRHHRELRVPHRVEDFVRRGGRGRERLVGSPISDANALGVDRRRSVSRRRLVSRLPDDVDDLGAVAVHAGLYQTRAVYHAVHDVVVVASEDEGQVELARRTLVLFFVEVAEREDQVCPFRLEQRFVPGERLPGVLDRRAVERARLG